MFRSHSWHSLEETSQKVLDRSLGQLYIALMNVTRHILKFGETRSLVSFSPSTLTHIFLLCLQFNDLQECYLQKRRQLASHPHNQPERDKNAVRREGYSAGLADFQSVLSTFTQYRYTYQSLFPFEIFF